jgi:hypothetical protein
MKTVLRFGGPIRTGGSGVRVGALLLVTAALPSRLSHKPHRPGHDAHTQTVKLAVHGTKSLISIDLAIGSGSEVTPCSPPIYVVNSGSCSGRRVIVTPRKAKCCRMETRLDSSHLAREIRPQSKLDQLTRDYALRAQRNGRPHRLDEQTLLAVSTKPAQVIQ